MKRDTRVASLLLFMTCVSLALLTAWQTWSSRERTLRDVNTDMLNLTQALDSYTEGVIRQCEVLLLDLADRIESDGLGPLQLEHLQGLLGRQQKVLSQVLGISLFDARGRWLLVSSGNVPPGASSADRAFFIHHRDDPSRDIFIGPPIRGRSTGQWVITVSRRLDHPDGSFAGVVVATLSIENFLGLFGRLDIGRHGAMSLTRDNGQLLVRHPFREADMGRDLSDSPLFSDYLRHADSGSATTTSRFDGVERLYVFRRNDHYPLVTTVALSKEEVLQDWRTQAELNAGIALALLVVLGLTGQRLLVGIRRRTRVSRQLASAREDLLRANDQLRVLATQDALTGLANRRCFDETLATEARRCAREGAPLSLLLIDIDHFKRYNDSYGHQAGDDCLKVVAGLLGACVRRPGDLVARYGGEELAVILPSTDEAGAEAVARGFLQRLAAERLEHRESPFGVVTASLGLATAPARAAGGREWQLVNAADRALYRAKADGRNRLEVERLEG
ncbi:diguanylate cyclase (GGDEF) domain-containing protein [Pseudomonas delhiensis]|uniref:diguanylate cyclase n=1 Tax=Pseudomonas delhiensis TaxID=366289 RepID=A0A239KDD0_9PSED|nr:sensor domain-containing diguanylate cyclase [Pseudomonas delhiensis]SDJ29700.1 diguanylate cyclase (GGDEF) domain-containing protein [Pseudomonas delhiensis]SNT16376.1 diguanylate cyclase (GGDEF) domain-containing protein [Pseudomonas delhiensis]